MSGLSDTVAALASENAAETGPGGAVTAAIDAAKAELTGDISTASADLHAEIAASAAAAQGLFDEASATALASRSAAQSLFDQAASGDSELNAFVAAMRAHFDFQSALRAAAVVAAGLSVATIQINDARSAIVSSQQVGLAKIGNVSAAFADFETAQVADNQSKALRLSALETRADGTDASVESLSSALSDAAHAAAAKSDFVAAGAGATGAAGDIAVFLAAMRASDGSSAAARSSAAALAGISRLDAAIADQKQALASSSFSLAALIGQNYAIYLAQVAAQATKDQSIVDSVTSLQTNLTTNYATTAALNSTLASAESYADGAVASLQASVAATYQPLSGMSAYATTTALASTLSTAESYADGAVSSLSAMIAATYQPLSGMSVYATTSALSTQIAAAKAYADSAVAALDVSLSATISGNYSTLTGQIGSLQTTVADLSKASAAKADYVGAALSASAGGSEIADFVAAMRAGANAADASKKAAVNAAGVQSVQAALSDLTKSVASLSSTTFARFGDNLALIQSQALALSDAAKALASKDDITASSAGPGASEVSAFVAAMRDASTVADAARSSARIAAAVAVQSQTQIDLSKSLASYSSVVAAQFGNVAASITSQATAIATLQGYASAAYALTLDVNGFITGYQLVNGGPGASSITFRTDKFAIAAPGGSGLPIFEVGTRDGATAVVLRAPLIADSSVTTGTIAGEAVTSFRSVSIATTYNGNGADQTVATFSFNVPQAGQAVVFYAADSSTATNFVGITIKIYVDGVLMATKYSISLVAFGGSYVNHVDATIGGLSLSQGAHTVQVVMNGASGSTISNQSITVFTGAR